MFLFFLFLYYLKNYGILLKDMLVHFDQIFFPEQFTWNKLDLCSFVPGRCTLHTVHKSLYAKVAHGLLPVFLLYAVLVLSLLASLVRYRSVRFSKESS